MKRQTTTYELSHFSKTLKPISQKFLGKNGLLYIDILSNWKQILGEEIGSYSLPQQIKYKNKQKNEATLIIAVKSSAFCLEINARKAIILQKINTFFGYQAITDIATIVADIISPKTTTEEKKLVSQEDVDYIKEQANDIKSQNLKEALENLGQSIIRMQKK